MHVMTDHRPEPDRNAAETDSDMDLSLCICANLRKTTRVVTQFYDGALHPTGLRAGQFTLLAVLAKLGDMPLTRLAEVLVMDRTTLSRNLKPLVARGLISNDSDADQRVRRVGLTGEGTRLFEAALPLWRQAQSRFFQGLGPEGAAALLEDLSATLSVTRDR